MPNKTYENYNMLIKETKTLLYYASTMGKIGYIPKRDIASKDIKDDMIHWLKPKCVVWHNVTILRVCMAGRKTSLKKEMAKAFIKGYSPAIHAIKQRNGNYKDCSLKNLYIEEKSRILSDDMSLRNAKPVEITSKSSSIAMRYPTMATAANGLNVHPKTLCKYLSGKTKRSVLDIYEFKVNGLSMPPLKPQR